MGAEVSGRAFLGLIQHVRGVHGTARLATIIENGGPTMQDVFSQRISKLGWYPYLAFTSFLVAAERALPRTERGASFELGVAAGKLDLGTVLKVYVALSSAERLIRSCKLVWQNYYKDAGRMEAIEWQPESTVLRIYDFPQMHRLHCVLMEAWMISTMESLGFAVGADARQTMFMGDGDPYHEFRCTWQRKRDAET